MTPDSNSGFVRPFSTKSQRADLLNDLDSFQTSLRNTNASAFKRFSDTNPNPGQIFNISTGLDTLEKHLSHKMRNFHEDLKASKTHSPMLRNQSPSKIKVYQSSGANSKNSPAKRVAESFRPILSSSFFKRQLKEDVSNVVDSIAPVSPLKKPKRSHGQPDPVKLDFGGFGKLSSSNYKPSSGGFSGTNSLNLHNSSDIFEKKSSLSKSPIGSLFNSLKKREQKPFFNENRGGLFNNSRDVVTKSSFLKGNMDFGFVNETSEKLRGLSGSEIEGLSNAQVRELLNLANLITKIAKGTKYYG